MISEKTHEGDVLIATPLSSCCQFNYQMDALNGDMSTF